MREILRYALTLLATAAIVCGLTQPASAQGPSLVVSSFAPVVHGGPETDALLALPRVVPPPQRLPPSTDHILLISAIAPKPAVDLLAAPTVPPAWLGGPTSLAPSKLAVIPSGLPAVGTVKPSVIGAIVARPRIVLTPIAAVPAPVIVAARPTLQPLTTSRPAIRSWPAAHLVRQDSRTQETRGVAYFETAPVPQAPTPLGNLK